MEQVLPFAPPEIGEDAIPDHLAQPPDAQSQDMSPPAHQTSVITNTGAVVPVTDRLWHFQRRYNRALLEDLALDREAKRLEAENAQLEDLILQYTEGVGLSDNVLADDNPLFVVNGR